MGGTFENLSERKHSPEGVRSVRESRAELTAEVLALERLHEASTRLWRSQDLHSGLAEILDASILLLGADMGNVQLLNPATRMLEIVAQRGFQQDVLELFREVSTYHDSACGRSILTGEKIIIEDVETDAGYAMFRKLATAAGYRAVQSTPLLSRTGEPLGMLSTHFRNPHRPSELDLRRLDLYVRQAADFIERQRIAAALRESEARLQKALAIETVGVIFLDMHGTFIDANDAFLRMSGYAREQIESRTVNTADTTLAEWMPRSDKALKQLETTWRSTPYEKELRRPDGSRWWGLFSATRLSDTEIVEYVIDVTAQKRAEEALQRAHDGLEERVRDRTAELLELNRTLLTEVTERRAAEEHARNLMKQIVTVQEVERANVTRDLHDHLGQQLTGLRLKLQNHQASCGDNAELLAEVDELQAIARQLDEDLDFLAWELRPAALDEFGLQVTLANFVHEWSKHFETVAEFHARGLDELSLRPEGGDQPLSNYSGSTQ